MALTLVYLAMCGLYDFYVVQLALRSGKHPVPVVYAFYVPSAEIATAVTLILAAIYLPLSFSYGVGAFAIALVLGILGISTAFIANRSYRRPPLP